MPRVIDAVQAAARGSFRGTRLIRLPDPRNSIAPNARLVFEIPPEQTYHGIFFEFRGAANALMPLATIAAEILEVRVIIDDETSITMTGAQWLAMNRYGQPFGAQEEEPGYLELEFGRRNWSPDMEITDGPAYGTLNVKQFKVELLLAGVITMTAARAKAQVSGNTVLGRYREIKRYPVASSAAGEYSFSELRGAQALKQVVAIHLDEDWANLSNIRLVSGSDTIHEGEGLDFKALARKNKRIPQANNFVLDFLLRGWPIESLWMLRTDLRLIFTNANAWTGKTILVESIVGEPDIAQPG